MFFQALIDYTESHWVSCGAKIRLVISNKPDAYGLQRAKDACISTEVGFISITHIRVDLSGRESCFFRLSLMLVGLV